MSLFERLSNPSSLKSQARETGVPAPILKKVYDRGVKDAKATAPEADKDAWGKARVDAFVRGGVDRAKDTDLWQKYHQEPQAEALAGETTTGVFLPLPDSLAHYFPEKEEDKTPPHVTLLFIGEVKPEDEQRVVEAVRSVADRWPPFRVDVVNYDEFVNEEGATIAHMVPSASICLSSAGGVYRGLSDLHADLYAAIEDAGVDVQHTYGGERRGDHGERVESFKPHTTLAYLPRGESYSGPKPTGSWHVTELEVWGHGKHRVPLGMKPDWVPVPQAAEVADEEDEGPTIEIEVQPSTESVDEERGDAPVTPVSTFKAVTALREDTQSATENTSKESLLRRALAGPVIETAKPLTTSIKLPEAPVRFVGAPAPQPKPVAPVQPKPQPEPEPEPAVEAAPAVEMEPQVVPDVPISTSPPHQVQLPSPPAPVPAPVEPVRIKPIQFFERFGHLSDSVLEIGGTEEHEYARLTPLEEDDHAGRVWKTIVCGTLAEQAPLERVATLLAARGLLAPEGQVLVALPDALTEDEIAKWERLFNRFFESTKLSSKGLLAWKLTYTRPMVEQTKPVAQTQLPPINLGPVFIRIPERQVQVQVHAPITQQVDMPANPPQQVTIEKGAVQIDMHQPPPSKKRVTMVKDGNGKVTGELEVVEDRDPKRPEFPTVEEIFAETSTDEPKQE